MEEETEDDMFIEEWEGETSWHVCSFKREEESQDDIWVVEKLKKPTDDNDRMFDRELSEDNPGIEER